MCTWYVYGVTHHTKPPTPQIGDVFNQLRLARQRVCYQPLDQGISCQLEEGEALSETLAQLLAVLEALDARIGMGVGIVFNDNNNAIEEVVFGGGVEERRGLVVGVVCA